MIVTVLRCPVHGPPDRAVLIEHGDVARCPISGCRLPLEKTEYGPAIIRGARRE